MKGKEKFGAEYHALRAMISRCYVPHHQSYKNYGAALCMVAGAALAIAGAILIWGEK